MRTSALLPHFGLMFQVDAGGSAASGGSGSSGGTGQGNSQGSNAPAQGAGQGQSAASASGGGNAPAHLALTADSMILPPGATAPVKFSDWQRGYVPLDRHNADKANAVATALKAIAAANRNKGRQTQPTNTQPVDPFADVRGIPVMSGDQVAQLAERVQREGIGPLYQWAEQVNDYLKKTNERLAGTERFAGSYNEAQQAAAFESKVGNVLSAVAKELLPGVNVDEHPVLREFAQDVYLSYNPNDPNLDREYPGILKSRLEGFMKVAGALTQAKLAQAREARKQFLRPGGAGQPSGQGGAPRVSHRDIARNYFAGEAASRT